MDSLKSVCRICLDYKVDIDWNNDIKELCGISYKYCYYKYTQLEEQDAECYPENLCHRCASELKNAHIFFEHALGSFKIIQNTFKAKELASENFTLKNSYSLIDEKEHYDIDEVICYSPVNDDVDIENELSEIICERNFESPSELSIQQQPIGSCHIKIQNSALEKKQPISKGKNPGPFETTLELNLQLEIQGSNLLKSSVKKNTTKCSLTKERRKTESEKSVPRQIVQCSVSIERVLDSNQHLTNSQILDTHTESLSTDAVNLFENQPKNTIDLPLLDINSSENNTIDTIPLNGSPSKPKEHKPYIAKSSGRKIGSELEEYLQFVQNLNGRDKHFFASPTKLLKSKRFQKISMLKQNEKSSEQFECIENDVDTNDLRVCKPQKQKEIMCQYCSKVFISVYKAIEHEKTHLENRERKETCTKCGLKFYNKNSLRSHMYTHKENREKNLKCEFCGKAFYNNNGLSVHRKIHVGPKIPCSICSKEYYRQSDLDKHMISHSATRVDGDLKYRKKYFVYCEICGNEVRSVEYKSHIAKHNNEPLAKCAICNKEFFSRKSKEDLEPAELLQQK